MISDDLIKAKIVGVLRAEDEERSSKHTPSGKLSASMLGSPLQWQVLKALSVLKEEVDDYTLAKFKRGRDVEDFVVDALDKSDLKVDGQIECNYRDVVGYLDLLLNIDGQKQAIEIKSVTNAAFKWIAKSGAKRGHILQGCLYALSLELDEFGVLYIASDDYRTKLFTFKTKDYKKEVDEIISKFERCMKEERIPKFEAIEKWQEDDKYNNFVEWKNKSENELRKSAITLFKARKERIYADTKRS